MKDRLSSNSRKWISLILAIILYYIIHEGIHLIVALLYNVFQKIKIISLGVQVVVDLEALTNFQIAIFSVVGCISTLLIAYILVFLTNQIVKIKNKLLKKFTLHPSLTLLKL